MTKYLLGVDIGSSSLKTAIIDENAKLIGLAGSGYRLISENAYSVQMDVQSAWRAFLSCLRLLKSEKSIDLSQIAGIGISSLCPGLAALGEDGEVLVNPILYSDRRSTEEAEIILRAVGSEKLFELTANGSMAGAFSGSSMLWIKRRQPEIYRKTKFFGHLNTLFAHRMTGHFGIDYSNASYTNLFETAGAKKWSAWLCDRIGIDMEKLPELHESTDVMGGLVNADLIQLGVTEGTPVVIGGADTPCATLAAGITKAGDVCESAGTTNVLTVCVDKPVFDRAFINRCHVVPGTWIYQGAMSFTGAANEWFLKRFCPELRADTGDVRAAFRRMNAEAGEAEPGCGGVVFLPYMLGERSPVWDPYARGVFFGLSLQTTRREMNRAILEGCGYGLRQLSEAAERVTGRKITEFVSIGGGAKSEIWAQIKADISGRDIKILDMQDMAPVGAALLGGVGGGVFRDVYEASGKVEKTVFKQIKADHRNDEIYDRRYEIYRGLYPALRELFHKNLGL